VGVDIDVGVEVGGGNMVRDKVYKGKEEKPVLALLSNLYSELVKIFIDTGKPLTSSTLHYLQTTYIYSY